MRRFVVLFAVAVMLAAPGLHARQARAVGVVLEVAGAVFLRPATTGQEVQLDRVKDVARALLEGQAIRCGPGGRVKMRLASGPKTLTAEEGRFELRYPSGATSTQQATLAALNAYARPGGTRALGATIFSPAHDALVRLDTLEVRWTPPHSTSLLTAVLRTSSNRDVWSLGDLSPSAGRLTAAATTALRAAIAQFRASNPVESWSLALRHSVGTIGVSTFRLLSRDDEMQLAARLREWDQEPEPIARAIGRAHEFATRRLYNDAADEFDRALASAPASEALLRAAIAAHDRTGNELRVRELNARVPKLEPVPHAQRERQ